MCCAPSAFEKKIYRVFRNMEEGQIRDDAAESLLRAFSGAFFLLRSECGFGNSQVEGLFSILRMLGLRHLIVSIAAHFISPLSGI